MIKKEMQKMIRCTHHHLAQCRLTFPPKPAGLAPTCLSSIWSAGNSFSTDPCDPFCSSCVMLESAHEQKYDWGGVRYLSQTKYLELEKEKRENDRAIVGDAVENISIQEIIWGVGLAVRNGVSRGTKNRLGDMQIELVCETGWGDQDGKPTWVTSPGCAIHVIPSSRDEEGSTASVVWQRLLEYLPGRVWLLGPLRSEGRSGNGRSGLGGLSVENRLACTVIVLEPCSEWPCNVLPLLSWS
jgi:hypothetical protein